MWLMQNGLANPDNAGRGSTDYLHLFGLTALAYMWALQAKAALARQAAGEDDPFYERKLVLARYYVERVLPETAAQLARITAWRGEPRWNCLTKCFEGPLLGLDAGPPTMRLKPDEWFSTDRSRPSCPGFFQRLAVASFAFTVRPRASRHT